MSKDSKIDCRSVEVDFRYFFYFDDLCFDKLYVRT